MAKKPEAGHVGGGGGTVGDQGAAGSVIEGAHDPDCLGGHLIGADPPLQRGGDDADTEGLGEHQHVAGACPGVGHQPVQDDGPGHGKPIGGFGPVDGMTSHYGAPGFGHHVHPSSDNRRGEIEPELVPRPSQVLEGSEGSRSHGVNVAQGVGSGDASPVIGRVHHGGEDVHGLDQGASVPQRIDAGVVTGAHPDHKVVMGGGGMISNRTQDLSQLGGAELAGSAGAVAVLGESDLVHRVEVKRMCRLCLSPHQSSLPVSRCRKTRRLS